MGTVSAIPENLYKYADVCTQGAEQFQNWIRTVLTPAMRAHERSGATVCSVLDTDVAKQLAAAFYTDRDVKTVGRAFQEAGGPTGRTPAMPISAPEKAVNASFQRLQQQYATQALQAQHLAQINAGGALAVRMEKNPGSDNLKPILEELGKHVNDPYFTAGFFNHLSQRQISVVMAHEGGIPALLKAYSGGALDKAASGRVANALGWLQGRGIFGLEHYPISYQQQTQFLTGLAADPVAARNFVDSLESAQLRELFHGGASVNPDLRVNLVKVLTVAMRQQPDRQAARTLMSKVSQGFFLDDDRKLDDDIKLERSEWKTLIGPMANFYLAGVGRSIPPSPAPGAGPLEWQKWVSVIKGDLGAPDAPGKPGTIGQPLTPIEHGAGSQIGVDIAPFLKAVNEADPDNELIKSMIQGGYVNVGFMWTARFAPQGIAGNIAYTFFIGSMQSLYSDSDKVKDYLDDKLPEGKKPDASNLNLLIARGGLMLVLQELIGKGIVHPANSDEPIKFNGDAGHDRKLLNDILSKPNDFEVGRGDRAGHEPPSINDLLAYFWSAEFRGAVSGLGGGDAYQAEKPG